MSRIALFFLLVSPLAAEALTLKKPVVKGKRIALFWRLDQVGQAQKPKGFFVYRATAKGQFKRANKKLLPLKQRYFIDRNIDSKVRYTYYVNLVNGKGKELLRSNLQSGESLFLSSVPTPRGLRLARRKKGGVLVQWQGHDFDGKRGANVYRRIGLDGEFKRVNKKPVKANRFADSYAGARRSYYYLTYLGGGKKESEPSPIISYKPRAAGEGVVMRAEKEPPGAPKGLAGKYLNTYVRLRWQPQYDSNLAGWVVYRASSKKGTWKIDGQVGKTAQPIFDAKKVALRTTVCYRVVAVSQAKVTSKPSKALCIKTPNPKPTPISGLEATPAGNGKVRLEWNGFDEANLTGFFIYYAPAGTKKFKKTKKISKSSFSHLLKLKRRKRYVFYGTSINSFKEESEKSERVEVTVY